MNRNTSTQTRVYLLWHSYKLSKENPSEIFIGVFATKADAKQAIVSLRSKNGFINHPRGFKIFEHIVGDIGWKDGFITV